VTLHRRTGKWEHGGHDWESVCIYFGGPVLVSARAEEALRVELKHPGEILVRLGKQVYRWTPGVEDIVTMFPGQALYIFPSDLRWTFVDPREPSVHPSFVRAEWVPA
jgi:hypothetical protein